MTFSLPKSTTFGPYRSDSSKTPFNLDLGGVGVDRSLLGIILIAALVSIQADRGFPSTLQDNTKKFVAMFVGL